ncbi:endonuclease/exonuclease/phosphatase family protein [Arcanobacterium haemolyticum]|nr:endonuclease/exonuclease/phosphatase family protein [Arcanobacterium haemolyticum]
MRITTCNVNGLRAAVRKGMPEWLAQAHPDVLLLQEVRAPDELIADLIGPGYQVFNRACDIKGRAGVTVAVREGIDVAAVRDGVAVEGTEEPPADTGRWLEVVLPQFDLTVISAYLFSGDAKSPEKMAEKYAHLDLVTDRLRALLEARKHTSETAYATPQGSTIPTTNFLVAGDFNIVHTPLDIKNWKPNHNKTSGVLDDEIAYLDRWFGELGLVDVQRSLTGEEQGPYTWWSQRGKAFENNVGWRIDYQMVTPQLAGAARSYTIGRAASYSERFSDHAPLTIEYEI